MNHLVEVAQHLGEVDPSRRAPDDGATEFRQLSLAFNTIADNLEDEKR